MRACFCDVHISAAASLACSKRLREVAARIQTLLVNLHRVLTSPAILKSTEFRSPADSGAQIARKGSVDSCGQLSHRSFPWLGCSRTRWQEYMDFLLGKNQQEDTEDCPSIIVGDGRISAILADFGKRRGYEDLIVKRGEPIPELEAGGNLVRKPIYVCTSADDLDAVVATCPEARREDLVFLQNGQLEPFRQRTGLYDTTQASTRTRRHIREKAQSTSVTDAASAYRRSFGSLQCARAPSPATASLQKAPRDSPRCLESGRAPSTCGLAQEACLAR